MKFITQFIYITIINLLTVPAMVEYLGFIPGTNSSNVANLGVAILMGYINMGVLKWAFRVVVDKEILTQLLDEEMKKRADKMGEK